MVRKRHFEGQRQEHLQKRKAVDRGHLPVSASCWRLLRWTATVLSKKTTEDKCSCGACVRQATRVGAIDANAYAVHGNLWLGLTRSTQVYVAIVPSW